MSGLVVLRTAASLPAGLLSWSAWQALRAADRVLTGDPDHPQLGALRAADVPVDVVDLAADPNLIADLAAELGSVAREGSAVWLAGSNADPVTEAVLAAVTVADPPVAVEELVGSVDPPGARLLDVVAVMDRLRSPGGCPWDAEQTHASLAKYLLEETYEAYEAIETDDLDALREEIGDVLLQVCFHARLAEELSPARRWDVDDVAAGLVEKLVRRHPHVFGDRVVSGAAEVLVNWSAIKVVEKGRTSVADGVPMGQPALALAAKLQQRAATAAASPDGRLPAEARAPLLGGTESPGHAVAAALGAVADDPDSAVERVGDLLFAVVALARSLHVDAEAALRGAARRFRDRLGELGG